jgi:hypothetical protein
MRAQARVAYSPVKVYPCALVRDRAYSFLGVVGWRHLPQDVVVDSSTDPLQMPRQLLAGQDYPSTYRASPRCSPTTMSACGDIELLRWPDGFFCRACGTVGEPWRATRGRLVRRSCRHQIRVAAGTILDKTRTPLTTWFEAALLGGAPAPDTHQPRRDASISSVMVMGRIMANPPSRRQAHQGRLERLRRGSAIEAERA